MGDEEQADLWKQMDETFSAAVQSSEDVAQHAHIGRAELEQHMREAHGILAETRLTLEPVSDARMRVGEEVRALDAPGEARLRASHWRAHESGFMPHRATEGEK